MKGRSLYLLLSGIFALLFLAAAGHFFYLRTAQLEQVIEKEKAHLESIKGYMHDKMITLQQVADSLSVEAVKSSTHAEALESLLKASAGHHPYINGIQVAYLPGKFPGKEGLYSPYYFKDDSGNDTLSRIGEQYDYVHDERGHYFRQALEKGSVWLEPYFGASNKKFLLEYATVMTDGEDTLGVVCVNYALEELNESLRQKSQKQASYLSVLSPDGHFIFHPNEELVKSHQNIQTLIASSDNKALQTAFEEPLAGNKGYLKYHSPVSGFKGWLIYDQLPLTNWVLHAVIDEHDMPNENRILRHHLFLVITFGLFSLLGFVMAQQHKRQVKVMYLALVILAANLIAWWVSAAYRNETDEVVINDIHSLDQHKSAYYNMADSLYLDSLHYIPTGIYVETIKREGQSEAQYSGYVWQKYPVNWPHAMDIIFPEAVSYEKEKLSEETSRDSVLIQWRFQADLLQPFNHLAYPLDSDKLWLKLRHPELNRNIILVPDLASYPYLTPSKMPGIAKSSFVQGFELEKSYFSYDRTDKLSRFGRLSGKTLTHFPELQFNIQTKRQVINAIIAHIIPLTIIFALLFFLLLMAVPKNKDNSLNILAACSGLFFVAIFDHIGLRDNLSVNNFIYFDFFYFLCYFNILIVTIISYLHSFHTNLFEWSEKQEKKMEVIFWPVNLLLIYFLSVWAYF